jgi:hypothetical protein
MPERHRHVIVTLAFERRSIFTLILVLPTLGLFPSQEVDVFAGIKTLKHSFMSEKAAVSQVR